MQDASLSGIGLTNNHKTVTHVDGVE